MKSNGVHDDDDENEKIVDSISLFRNVFTECSKFSKRVYEMLSEYENLMSQSAPKHRTQERRKYMNFVKSERVKVQRNHPEAKLIEIGRILSKQWIDLKVEERNKYVEEANEEDDTITVPPQPDIQQFSGPVPSFNLATLDPPPHAHMLANEDPHNIIANNPVATDANEALI